MNLTSTDLKARFFALDLPRLAREARGGGVYGDIFAEDSESFSVRLEGARIARVAHEHQRGVAARALARSGATRFATSTSLDSSVVRDLARQVAFPGAGRDATPGAETRIFTAEGVPPAASTSLEERIRLVELADASARALAPEVREVSVSLRDGVRRTLVAGSDGRVVLAEAPRAVIAVEVIATSGDVTQSTYEAMGGPGGISRITAEVVTRCARLAGERALRMLRARPAPAGEMAVVLAAEAGGTFVHEAVGHALEADLVLEGLSGLGDRIGERIASEKISVLDDATVPGQNGTFQVDDEGVPGERTLLVDKGVLVALLHDERTALLLGAKSSGKGRRESFRHRPIVRMSNTMIAPGEDDPAEILADTRSGLYVVRMGGGEVDTVTGQFVFEVSEAYRIEGGRIGEPVRGATLAGDAVEVLASIDRVGSDLGFGIGTCGKDGQDVPVSDAEPTIRIPRLVVGGS